MERLDCSQQGVILQRAEANSWTHLPCRGGFQLLLLNVGWLQWQEGWCVALRLRSENAMQLLLDSLSGPPLLDSRASLVVLVVKNLLASAGDRRDAGSVPGLGRSPGGGHGNTHSSILPWRIPWTEEPGRLQSSCLRRGHNSRCPSHIHCPLFEWVIIQMSAASRPPQAIPAECFNPKLKIYEQNKCGACLRHYILQ